MRRLEAAVRRNADTSLLLAACMLVTSPRTGAEPASTEPVIRGSAEWLAKVGADAPARAGWDDPEHGAEHNPTGDPIGGGTGYSRIVSPDDARAVVRNAEQFFQALSAAGTGTIIYVADDAMIDLTAEQDIVVPTGVTIASGRGRGGSEGGLIFTHTVKSARLFRTGGPNIRFTGLRLEGPYPGRERLTQRPTLMGISHPNVEVDNCEIFAWSCAAVGVGAGAVEGAWVHHNYIHHNQRSGLGYGVSLGRTHVLIEGNLFDFCRHAIASSGTPRSGYTARYNVHMEHTISHVFDMHGARDFEKYMQVGLWHFDDAKGTRADDRSIYNGNHEGKLHNGGPENWAEGHIGGALWLDGMDDYVDMGKQRQLSPPEGLSVTAWIKPDRVTGTQAVFSKADTGKTGSGYSLRLVDGTLEGTLFGPDGIRRQARAGQTRAGGWQHVGMTWNGKDALLYVDGEVVGGFACAGRSQSANHLIIGRDSATATSAFGGALDEARLYSRAISPDDIRRQYEGHGDISGRLILVHHNTIRSVNYAALTVRGRPSVGCWVHHNKFYAIEGAPMVIQHNATGNLHVSGNRYLGRGIKPAPDFTQGELFGQWTFDEEQNGTARDTSGRNRHGEIRGEISASAWIRSPEGRALVLQGGTRSLLLPKAGDDDFPDRVALGVRMRVDDLRPRQVLIDNGLFRIFHRGDWAGHRLYFLCRTRERERSGESSWEYFAGVRTKREVKEGEWFELVGERDGDTMRVSLNGMLESEAKCVAGVTPAVWRRGPLATGPDIDGAIDELWIRSSDRGDGVAQAAQAGRFLFVTRETGSEKDGVAPDSGDASTLFRFRVLFRDPGGRQPAIGFPRVHILRDGKAYLNEAPVTMLAVDGAPVESGRVYIYTMRLPRANEYAHYFEVETTDGETDRSGRFVGPSVTEGSFAPVLSWTSHGGYVRDGVEPEIGDADTEFDFRVLFSDVDGDAPLEGQPRVHITRGGNAIDGSPFPMTAMTDVPTWQGRAYQFRTKLAAGDGYAHYFTAMDAEGNEAPQSLTRDSPTVDAGKDVAAPDLSSIRVAQITPDAANIQWETDEPATALVEYGRTTDYGLRAESAVHTTQHELRLTSLDAGVTYHYRVSATDEAKNRARSGDYTFRTLAE